MRCGAAVSVHNNLAARKARVAIRPANKKLAGGINMPDGVLGDPALGQRLRHIRLHQFQHVLGSEALVNMLVRNHDMRGADRLAVLVLNGDLAF